MSSYKQSWEEYQKILKKFGYSEEQISAVKEIRENLDHCTFEQFTELFQQGLIVRTRKLKKKRNLYTDGEKFYYLDHYERKYCWNGYFKNEENEE